MGEIIAFQEEFRQVLPNVTGNVDYEIFRKTLARITELIKASKIDQKVMSEAVRLSEKEYNLNRQSKGKGPDQLTNKEKIRIQKRARRILRCGIARHLTGDAYRVFSCRLADSALLQNFCLIDRMDQIKVPSKSQLQRDEALFEEGFLRKIVSEVTGQAAQAPDSEEDKQVLGLAEEVSLEQYFLDTTCLKANIHFPVDWVLLRDATRTLMKAV
jgi:predicted HicB family RNase H-like nuclease